MLSVTASKANRSSTEHEGNPPHPLTVRGIPLLPVLQLDRKRTSPRQTAVAARDEGFATNCSRPRNVPSWKMREVLVKKCGTLREKSQRSSRCLSSFFPKSQFTSPEESAQASRRVSSSLYWCCRKPILVLAQAYIGVGVSLYWSASGAKRPPSRHKGRKEAPPVFALRSYEIRTTRQRNYGDNNTATPLVRMVLRFFLIGSQYTAVTTKGRRNYFVVGNKRQQRP